jgi:hypothetical protein
MAMALEQSGDLAKEAAPVVKHAAKGAASKAGGLASKVVKTVAERARRAHNVTEEGDARPSSASPTAEDAAGARWERHSGRDGEGDTDLPGQAAVARHRLLEPRRTQEEQLLAIEGSRSAARGQG